MRKYTLDRWNWSEKAGKWVYVTKKGGKRKYTYQLEPPPEFIELTNQLQVINQQIMSSPDQDIKEDLFKELQDIANKMQMMGR